jgi:hypothetical protein
MEQTRKAVAITLAKRRAVWQRRIAHQRKGIELRKV